jgi:excinuclease UvrABC nuclease subunit
VTLEALKKLNLPDVPGVYFFKLGKEILYIGKATSLKDRVRSYFGADLIATRGPKIVDMVTRADGVEWQECRSVLEALVLEAALIRKHQPKANTDEKDDKSYYFVCLTAEEYPAVELVRGRTLEFLKSAEAKKFKSVFGPFPHGGQLKEALGIVRKIFPYRDLKCRPPQARPCFSYQIGLCPGCCIGKITPAEYAKTTRRLSLLLDGKIGALERDLERAMASEAKARRFEVAEVIKRQLFSLRHIRDASLVKADELAPAGFRIEAYDVAHYAGENAVGVMAVLEDSWPKKAAYRTFTLRGKHRGDDLSALRELLERRLGHPEWGVPGLVVADGNLQRELAEEFFRASGVAAPVTSIVKDDRHRAARIDGPAEEIKKYRREILLANSEAHRFAVATLRAKARKQATGKTRRRIA